MAEKLEELQLPKAQVEIESRGAIYAVPFFKDVADAELEKPSLSPEDTRHPPVDTSSSSARGRHPSSAAPFPTAPAVPKAGIPHSCAVQPGSPSPADQDGATGTGGRCTEARQEPSRTGRSSSAQGWGAESSSRDAGTELFKCHLTEGAPMARVLVSWCGGDRHGAVGLSLPCLSLHVLVCLSILWPGWQGAVGRVSAKPCCLCAKRWQRAQAKTCCGTGECNGQAGARGWFRGRSITRPGAVSVSSGVTVPTFSLQLCSLPAMPVPGSWLAPVVGVSLPFLAPCRGWSSAGMAAGLCSG